MNPKTPNFLARNSKWLLRGFYGLCALLVIADLFSHGHSQHPWQELPAFYGIFSFFVCLALAVVAKLLSKLIKLIEYYYNA